MTRQSRHRRKVLIDSNNHDRWIVSYADFITLLFAFFVVMYSISSVNEGKYRSLTDSLGTAFSNNDSPKKIDKAIEPVQPEASLSSKDILAVTFESTALIEQKTANTSDELGGITNTLVNERVSATSQSEFSLYDDPNTQSTVLEIPFDSTQIQKQPLADNDDQTSTDQTRTDNPATANASSDATESTPNQLDSLSDSLSIPFESAKSEVESSAEVEKTRELSAELIKEQRHLNQVSDQLETALKPFIDDKLVSVKRNDYWVELEMNSELLFVSGEAALSPKAQPALKKIAEVVNELPNAINVEGHTDNVPIGTLIFPSNWELSSARATSVVQELIKEGTDPTRLSAIGYGEFHPIADNSTEEGRFQNRRVTLVLMSQAFSRYGANDEERAKLLNLTPTAKQP